MLTASAPGRLYVTGEYSVCSPGARAITVAVDRYVHVQLVPRDNFGRIRTSSGSTCAIWRHGMRGIEFGSDKDRTARADKDNSALFTKYSLAVVEELRRERGLVPLVYDLVVTSELVDPRTHMPLGLGVNSGIVVAIISAISALYELNLSAIEIYKLGMIVTVGLRPNSSGTSIAASAFGGWLNYASPDRDWINEKISSLSMVAGRNIAGAYSLHEILLSDWPGLELLRIKNVALQGVVGWTGSAVLEHPEINVGEILPVGLIDDADNLVWDFASALEEGQLERIPGILDRSSEVLRRVERKLGISIFTPSLDTAVSVARGLGWAAKTSGAGGGGCSLALGDLTQDSARLEQELKTVGILPLRIVPLEREAMPRIDLDTVETAGSAGHKGVHLVALPQQFDYFDWPQI